MTELALTAFATLFVIIDPIGLAPIFVALTRGMNTRHRMGVALRACLLGIGILALFGLAGEAVLDLIGIGMPAFRISGGLLLFMIAVEMLFERRTERRGKSADKADTSLGPDPTVFPLAVPLLAGPGALTTMILLTGQNSGDPAAQAVIFGVMVAVVLVAFALFLLAGTLERILGPVGIGMITRLLGMLLAALAVQFVVNGLYDLGVLPKVAG